MAEKIIRKSFKPKFGLGKVYRRMNSVWRILKRLKRPRRWLQVQQSMICVKSIRNFFLKLYSESKSISKSISGIRFFFNWNDQLEFLRLTLEFHSLLIIDQGILSMVHSLWSYGVVYWRLNPKTDFMIFQRCHSRRSCLKQATFPLCHPAFAIGCPFWVQFLKNIAATLKMQ